MRRAPGSIRRVMNCACHPARVVGSDFGRHGEHPGARMSIAWMPNGRAWQQPAFTVSDVRRSQRTTRNTSIQSRDAQDPVPILVTGRTPGEPHERRTVRRSDNGPLSRLSLAGVMGPGCRHGKGTGWRRGYSTHQRRREHQAAIKSGLRIRGTTNWSANSRRLLAKPAN
jgi:hypothetical protein